MKGKVIVGMSGGVDSAAAAVLLKEAGYQVEGMTLSLCPDPESRDAADAKAVCDRLGIPHHLVRLEEDFEREVIRRFAEGYAKGETPNPCVDCNRYIKFGKMLEAALSLGADFLATGHYANVTTDPETGKFLLTKAADPRKDQTYMLYTLTQERLAHVLFPLGGMTKAQNREVVEKAGLEIAGKPDSQDICFIKDGDYAGFLERAGVVMTPGSFIDPAGGVLGQHQGQARYTVGQRKGLGLSFDSPRYVLAKSALENTVTLGTGDALFSDRLVATDCNWISGGTPKAPFRATVKTRYSQTEAPATVTPLSDGNVQVEFDTPQRALTPGQAAVFYHGEQVLGGGRIL